MKIGIAGVGGIGSNVALHLVRSGIKNLKFGDFDKIDESNLNRQFYFKEQIGKYKVECLRENLTKISHGNYEGKIIKFDRENIKEFFSDCDIIIEGFDNKEYKSLFLEEFFNTYKTLIMTSGIAGLKTEGIKVSKILPQLYIVGDMESDISEFKTYSHKVNIVAGKIVEIILGRVKNEKENGYT